MTTTLNIFEELNAQLEGTSIDLENSGAQNNSTVTLQPSTSLEQSIQSETTTNVVSGDAITIGSATAGLATTGTIGSIALTSQPELTISAADDEVTYNVIKGELNSVAYNDMVSLVEGTDANDEIFGTDGANDIVGGNGDDKLHSGAGWDWLFGGQGDDTFVIGKDINSTVEIQDFGQGNDKIDLSQFEDITSFEDLDILQSYSGSDIKLGEYTLKVNGDTLYSNGDYQLNAADPSKAQNLTANDFIFASGTTEPEEPQSPEPEAPEEYNVVHAAEYGSYTFGTDGNDEIFGSEVADTIIAGKGDDIIHTSSGWDWLLGGQGDDTFVVDELNDAIVQIVDFGEGNDKIDLSHYKDITSFEDLNLTKDQYGSIITIGGNNILITSGTSYVDGVFEYNEDSTKAQNLTADDFIFASPTTDPEEPEEPEIPQEYNVIEAGEYDFLVQGSSADDEIFGNDALNDIVGGQGNDKLHSGAGWDWLFGGQGDDTFVIGDNINTTVEIQDFGQGNDKIDLSQFEDITSFEDLNITQTSNGSAIAVGGQILKVNGDMAYDNGYQWNVADPTKAQNLTADDFIFAGNDDLPENPGTTPEVPETPEVPTESVDGYNVIKADTYGSLVVGTEGNDEIFGNDYANDIVGGLGNDKLHAGKGEDWLIGQEGDDIFVIDKEIDSTVSILDFNDNDVIDLSAFEDIKSFDDLQFQNQVVGYSTGVILGDYLLEIKGAGSENLTADDFIFSSSDSLGLVGLDEGAESSSVFG